MQSANLSGPFRGCLYYALLGLPQATGLAGGYDFQRSKFYLCVGSFTAPREWLIPPSTNINVYAAAEQLTFQMI